MEVFDVTDGWIAFLSNRLVDMCIARSTEECLGCQHKRFAPILHRHIQWGLHDQIGHYFVVTRQSIVANIETIYENYQRLVQQIGTQQPHQPLIKAVLIKRGIRFLSETSPADIYYGRYKSDFNEYYLEPIYQQALTQNVGVDKPTAARKRSSSAGVKTSKTKRPKNLKSPPQAI